MKTILKKIPFTAITIFLLLKAHSLKAFDNDLFVRGGVNLTHVILDSNQGNNNNIIGGGIHTQFGARFNSWEFLLSSTLFFAHMKQTHKCNLGRNDTACMGPLESTSLAPLAKYFTGWSINSHLHNYLFIGPVWAIQTIRLDDIEYQSETYSDNYKLSYLSRGINLGIGFEEYLLEKKEYPYFIEFSYSIVRAYQLNLIDITNFTESVVLEKFVIKEDIVGHIFSLQIGTTLF